MVFCDIIRQVFIYLFPEYVEMILSYYVADQIQFHVYCSVSFPPVPLTMLFDAVFYVAVSVGGCKWPISDRAVCMDVAFWQFSNSPPNYSSMADAMMFIIILHYTCNGLCFKCADFIGVWDFGPRK